MTIQGSVLTQQEKTSCQVRQHPLRDFDHYVFDGRMFDCLSQFVSDKQLLSEIRKSIKDESCSKQFQHVEPMMETARQFCSVERPDGRHKKAVRAAIVLLEKYLLPDTQLTRADYHGDGWQRLLSNEEGAAGIVASGTKLENIEYLIQLADRMQGMIHAGVRFGDISIPAKCFHRAQISGYVSEDGQHYDAKHLKKKDRLVMGVDGATVLIEATYFKPIYDLLKSSWTNYAGGKSPEQLRYAIQRWRENRYWLGLDYSKFDMHVPSWLIYECFNILKRKYFGEADWKVFDWVAYNFVHTQFQLPDGTYGFKQHGIPSGSNGTQPIGSMCNAIMTLAGFLSTSGKHTAHEMIDWGLSQLAPSLRAERECIAASFMGDDGLIFVKTPIIRPVMQSMARYIFDVFGVEMSVEKSAYGFANMKDPQFLKREWRRSGEYQNPLQLFINVIHNERERTYVDFEPIHILYGLWYCYKSTFDELGIYEYMLVEAMNKTKQGIAAILSIPNREQPGVFRGAGENMTKYLYRRAERQIAPKLVG